MESELNLVTQLAIILIAAGVFTVLSKALKQPLILGYIIAGFIVGPHLGLFPQFSPESVNQWSELGIIFMLFGLGLEFNFKKLLGVGGAAIITALTVCLGMITTGFILGTALGWTATECIFLGGMLSMSSTAIVLKAYDDMEMKDAPHAPLLFGMLVVEDLLAVLLLVVFNTIAVSNTVSGGDLLLSLAKLVAFLVLCFLIGIYVLPPLLKKAKPYLNDEILLLISVGLCFLMVLLANLAGFSSALGAFLIGSILSSTIEGEQIEHVTVNIKNLFGAIFFVSVGMMVDPAVIGKYWLVILIITLVTMAGILLFSILGVLLSGKDLRTAVNVGFSLPQIGEFSFIIAGVGLGLGVLSDFIYPVIIAVSVITTFTTPYVIKAAGPAYSFLSTKLPAKLVSRLNERSSSGEELDDQEKNGWKIYFKSYFLRIGLYGILCTAVLAGGKAFLPGLALKTFPHLNETVRGLMELAVILAAMSPFLYGMLSNSASLKRASDSLIRNSENAKIWLIATYVLRAFIAAAFVLMAVFSCVNLKGWSALVVLAALALVYLASRVNSRHYGHIEEKFLRNLNAKEELMKKKNRVSTAVKEKISDKQIQVKPVTVSSDFNFAGKTLREMPFRHRSGVNIVKIQRGSHEILIPSGDEPIFPGDILVAVGSKGQIDDFEAILADCSTAASGEATADFTVESIDVAAGSFLADTKLADTKMRSFGCVVISVIRGGKTIVNPAPEFVFLEGDCVWMAGERQAIDWFRK